MIRPAVYRVFPLLLLLVAAASTCARAQITVSGRVFDEHDEQPLAYANLFLPATEAGTQTDVDGYFTLPDLPAGPTAIRFSHVGCEPLLLTLDLRADTSLTVYLHHHDNFAETVTVRATEGAAVAYSERLEARSDRQLADVLETVNGVSTLRTGTAAAKPVYDGVYGNRLSLQNNGVAQSGQQWGNDHAPEIDPWMAAYVRVIDGVDALRYAGTTLGATVLIEPAPLTRRTTPALRAKYTFQANGRGHTLNARLTDSTALATYRLSGSLKAFGDQRAPGYLLNNTGRREANFGLQAAKFHNAQLTSRFYYSLFSANIGVLRGSHIGNLTDLNRAFSREQPFFTEDTFSYELNSPRQTVVHHLLKAEIDFHPDERTHLLARYGGQLNDRKEFDVRRGDDNIPALSLQQFNHLFELAATRELGPDDHFEAGLQTELTDNENNPETGILPLIPNYEAQRVAAYATWHRERDRWQAHLGLRTDYRLYEVVRQTQTIPPRIVRPHHTFWSTGGSAEVGRRLGTRVRAQASITYRERAPEINELYSQGLHQGVSGIEEGDDDLRRERGIKSRLTLRYADGRGRLTLNASAFHQRVRDYIALEPEQELRQTIRGAFPVFRYRGTDARLWGANLSILAQLTSRFDLDARLALVRGYDVARDLPLVFIPSDNARTRLTYVASDRLSFGATWLLVREQTNYEAGQDFRPPPPGYQLLDAEVNWVQPLSEGRTLDFGLEVTNVFDTAYRDYLDRQRYYADALGRGISLRLGLKL